MLLCQIAKMRGARVIGTCPPTRKAKLAAEAAPNEVILYTAGFEEEVKRLTDGKGLQVVYDSVGKDHVDKSYSTAGTRAATGLYGQSSGPSGPWTSGQLGRQGLAWY